MGLIDKTAKVTIKTSVGMAKASSTLVKRTSQTALNLAVNYTPDIYDKHEDLSKGATMFAIGNSAMVARNAVRMERSVHSFAVSTNAKFKKRKIKKKNREITETKTTIEKYEKAQQSIREKTSQKYSGVSKDGLSQKFVDQRVRQHKGNLVELEKETKLVTAQHKRLMKKKRRLQSKGFKPVRSLKRTVSNQTRRASAMLNAKDDVGTKSIGMSIKGVWAGIKFKRNVTPIAKSVVSITSNVISGIITFITSIPAMITVLVSCLPIILVILIVMTIISPVVSTSYSGRIGTLYSKIDELNEIYEVDVQPAEVLAITDALDWTTQKEEQFEQLYSIMLNQKKGNNLSFEEMAQNVFIKYNPINKYDEGIYDKDMKTGIYYWSLEGLDINFIISNSVKRNLLYHEYIDLYPTYKRAGNELRSKMKTREYQNNMIKEAKNKISVNQQRYEDYIFEQQLGDVELDITENNETGLKIAKKALTKLGCDYIWGAGHGQEYKDIKLKEFDCSGLVNWSFYQSGINIGDQTTKTLLKMGKSVNRNQLQAGDIILFNTTGEGVSHVGIYIGNGKMVHAPTIGSQVKVAEMNTDYWNKRFVDCRRLY